MSDRSSGRAARRYRRVVPAVVFCLVALVAGVAVAANDWNDAAIDWQGYDEGLAVAKSGNKPVCLVFYTEWCPHCQRYSQVFKDPALVEMTKKFVMIRVERDGNPAVSAKYKPDGEYIPRTYFLTPDGELQPDIHEKRSNYLYFYNTSDPKAVMRGMQEALDAAKPAGGGASGV